MVDIRKEEYNKFTNVPLLPYNCIKYLMDNNETLWKLLKYPTNDAWSKTNLTTAEKADLIYAGEIDATNYRVFIGKGLDQSWTEQACILRVSSIDITPTNYIFGLVTMAFEIYCHYSITTLSNYTDRIDSCVQSILETLNGSEITGLGRLFFDSRITGKNRISVIGEIPFKGKVLLMSNWDAN